MIGLGDVEFERGYLRGGMFSLRSAENSTEVLLPSNWMDISS